MTLKRILCLFLIVMLLLFILLGFALSFFGPGYLEKNILPKLAKTAGIDPFSCQIRRIGLTGIDIGRIEIGNGVSVDSLQIDYQPKELLNRHIRHVSIIGADVQLLAENGNISIGGPHLPENSDLDKSSKYKPTQKPFHKQMLIDRFSLKKTTIVCNWEEKTIRLPVEAEVVIGDPDQGIYRYLINFRFRDGIFKMAGEVNATGKFATLGLEGQGIRVEQFSDFLPVVNAYGVSCMADIKARAKIALPSLITSGLSVSVALHQLKAQIGDMVLRSASNESDSSSANVKIDTDDLATWHFSISNASAGMTWGKVWADVDGLVSLDKDRLAVDGRISSQFTTSLNRESSVASSSLPVFEKPLPIQCRFNGKKVKGMPWEINVASQPETISEKEMPWHVFWDDITIKCLPPELQLSVSIGDNDLSYQFGLEIPKPDIKKGPHRLKWSSVTFSGERNQAEDNGPSKLLVFGKVSNGQIVTDAVKGILPQLDVSGALSMDSEPFGINGNVSFSKGSVSLPQEDIQLRGISGRMPFRWPLDNEKSTGYLRVATMTWEKKPLGSIQLELAQRQGQIAFKGSHMSRLFKNMVVNLSGETNLHSGEFNSRVNLSLPSYQLGPDLALDRFMPDASGILLSGEVTVDSEIFFSKNDQTGTLNIGLKNGQLKDEAKKLSLDGISVNVTMPDVFKAKSAPNQLFHIGSLSYGDLVAGDFTAAFQIESPDAIFIEQSRFKWCDGLIQTQPLRIRPGIDNYDVTFYCDRLGLTCLLEQLGAVTATGGGTVNGRIPIKISNNKISFEDGFLYSTPGGGGHIHLSNTEMLTAGMPPDSPQYVQLDIAREALKDYEYKWVKVYLSTIKDNLDLKLQFDGKPGDVLPFVYKKELGRFIRVDATGKGSRFQGIRLDVNFKLPLDDLLQYKDIMDQLK